MITAVDSNVLIDVFRDDPVFCSGSSAAVRVCIQEGRLVVCDVVWAELATLFPTEEDLEEKLTILGVVYSAMDRGAATLAGGCGDRTGLGAAPGSTWWPTSWLPPMRSYSAIASSPETEGSTANTSRN